MWLTPTPIRRKLRHNTLLDSLVSRSLHVSVAWVLGDVTTMLPEGAPTQGILPPDAQCRQCGTPNIAVLRSRRCWQTLASTPTPSWPWYRGRAEGMCWVEEVLLCNRKNATMFVPGLICA